MRKKTASLIIIIAALAAASGLISCGENKTKTSAETETPAVNENFANEREVVIGEYTGDAMEPFIAADGTLFFNSLNTVSDVKLYCAGRVSDAEFSAAAEIGGANAEGENLDAVASVTDAGELYWVTNQNYPTTCSTGAFAAGSVTGITAVTGDFYINKLADPTPEFWTIMDAEVSRDGSRWYFVNAQYNATWSAVLKSTIGVADKSGTSFVKNANSAAIFANVNDPAYLVYAPTVSADGLELFYTRFALTGGANTEICRAVRASATAAFGSPTVLAIAGTLPEGPCLSRDGKKLYYHKNKAADGLYHIYVMTR